LRSLTSFKSFPILPCAVVRVSRCCMFVQLSASAEQSLFLGSEVAVLFTVHSPVARLFVPLLVYAVLTSLRLLYERRLVVDRRLFLITDRRSCVSQEQFLGPPERKLLGNGRFCFALAKQYQKNIKEPTGEDEEDKKCQAS